MSSGFNHSNAEVVCLSFVTFHQLRYTSIFVLSSQNTFSIFTAASICE